MVSHWSDDAAAPNVRRRVKPHGFKTYAYTSPDGSRQAVLIYNDFKMSIPRKAGGTGTPAFQRDVKKATEIAFCGQR